MLTIIGGTYFELCEDPNSYELYGSGLRAAAALSQVETNIDFVSCIGRDEKRLAESICNTFNIKPHLSIADDTALFFYRHPLSPPICNPQVIKRTIIKDVNATNILYYGMIDADVNVSGDYVVYDPQNGVSFKDTGSSAKHLALILNKKEALQLSGAQSNADLESIGKSLLSSEKAEVVVIKNGARGALVIYSYGIFEIPVFETSLVWPIGSGDMFSAIFAWRWISKREQPEIAARIASLYTAQFCETRALPVTNTLPQNRPLPALLQQKKVYLAGPFFNIAERWLIGELRRVLIEFGNTVFSPIHDAGLGTTADIIQKDITAIHDADILLAVANGLDSNTFFEIGYAKALNKKIIVLAENIREDDLIMASNTACEITTDFSTAVYKTSW